MANNGKSEIVAPSHVLPMLGKVPSCMKVLAEREKRPQAPSPQCRSSRKTHFHKERAAAMCARSISPISSPADLLSGIEIETLDLVSACPLWTLYGLDCIMRRVLGIRERWSHRTVMISGPRTIDQVNAERSRDDLHTMLQMASQWKCGSAIFWRAIGPAELMEDLRGSSGEKHIPWTPELGPEVYAAAVQMSLYLCQHEIRGD